MAAANADPVVDRLMTAAEGDRVLLEAQYYEFSTPFEVEAIDEDAWRAPTGGVWRSRRLTLESKPEGPGRVSRKTIDVYQDGPAPELGSYGQLVAVRGDGEQLEEPASQDDEVDEVVLERLPDGVTVADVECAAEECETLDEVAEEIGVDVDATRTVTVRLGCYSRVRETFRHRGRGGRDE